MRSFFFLVGILGLAACGGVKPSGADPVTATISVASVPEGGSVTGLLATPVGDSLALNSGNVASAGGTMSLALSAEEIVGATGGPIEISVTSMDADGGAIGDSRSFSASENITADDGSLAATFECTDDGTTLACLNCAVDACASTSDGGGSSGGGGHGGLEGGLHGADDSGLVIDTGPLDDTGEGKGSPNGDTNSD